MVILEHLKSRSLILEAKEPYREIETDACSTLNTQLGFASKLFSLSGYDPFSLSPVFAATQRISNAIGMLPWTIKTYSDAKVQDNNYLKILFDKCVQTRFIFVKNLIKDVIINGNAYALIERNTNGTPTNLIYLRPGQCTPLVDSTGTKLFYNIPQFKKGYVEPINVLHFFMDSADGIQGRALIDFARNTIKLSQYTEKAASDYFGSGMRLTGVLSTTAPRLTEQQRNDIRNAYLAGMSSGSGIAVLENGMTFSSMSNNAKDSSLIDTRLYNVQEVGRFFNISPVQLGDLSHTQYGSIEQSQLDFLTNTLAPWIEMLEAEINRKLVLPRDKTKYHIDLDTNCLLKTDRQSFANYISTLISNSIITINEARNLLGMSPIEGGDERNLHYAGTTQQPGVNGLNKDYPNKNNNDKQDEANTNI